MPSSSNELAKSDYSIKNHSASIPIWAKSRTLVPDRQNDRAVVINQALVDRFSYESTSVFTLEEASSAVGWVKTSFSEFATHHWFAHFLEMPLRVVYSKWWEAPVALKFAIRPTINAVNDFTCSKNETMNRPMAPMALTLHGESLCRPPFGQRRERYLMVYTPTVSRFGVSHGFPGATVANAKTANSRMKIVHGVALREGRA